MSEDFQISSVIDLYNGVNDFWLIVNLYSKPQFLHSFDDTFCI